MKTYITEEELKNVASGSCWTSINDHEEAVVVTSGNPCGCSPSQFQARSRDLVDIEDVLFNTWYDLSSDGQCGRCVHLDFTNSLTGYCGKRRRPKA